MTILHEHAPGRPRTAPDPDLIGWCARRTVAMHLEGPDADRVTGVCRHCGEADPCPCLVASIHYLRRAAGLVR